MALLNPVDLARPFVRPAALRLNWRLLLALAATAGFWIVAGEALLRVL